MFELWMIAAVLFALFLVGSLVGAVLKLVFGLAGALFGLVGGLIGLGIGLMLLPLMALALLPLLFPALLVFGAVWLIVRASRPAAPTPVSSTR